MSGYMSATTLDLLAKGKEGRVASAGSGDREPIWFMPRNEELVLTFTALPTEGGKHGWFPFREASAKGVLIPGTWSTGEYAGTPRGELPWRMQEIPVEDIETVIVDNEPKLKYRRPFLEVLPGQLMNVVDDIIDARSQRFTDDNGRTKVDWMVLVNAVVWEWPDIKKKDGTSRAKPAKGELIALKMPKRVAQMIVERLAERMEEDPDLDPREYQWRVTLVGGQPNSIILKRASKLEAPLDITPHDLESFVVTRKERFEEHIKAAYADMASPQTAKPDFVDSPADESEEYHATDAVADKESKEFWELTTTAALRSRLKKAGVEIPSGSSRDKLIELAAANLSA